MSDMETIEADSILNWVKTKLGAEGDYDPFDHDILTEINTALSTIFQVGAGDSSYRIDTAEETWDEFYESTGLKNKHILEMVKEYVFLSTKINFDPPESSYATDNLVKKKDELEWRIKFEEDYL